MASSISSLEWPRGNFATPPRPDSKVLGATPPPCLEPNALNCECAQSAAQSGTRADSPKDLQPPLTLLRARGEQFFQVTGNGTDGAV